MSFRACVTVWLVFPPFMIMAVFTSSTSLGALLSKKRLERLVLGFLGIHTNTEGDDKLPVLFMDTVKNKQGFRRGYQSPDMSALKKKWVERGVWPLVDVKSLCLPCFLSASSKDITLTKHNLKREIIIFIFFIINILGYPSASQPKYAAGSRSLNSNIAAYCTMSDK